MQGNAKQLGLNSSLSHSPEQRNGHASSRSAQMKKAKFQNSKSNSRSPPRQHIHDSTMRQIVSNTLKNKGGGGHLTRSKDTIDSAGYVPHHSRSPPGPGGGGGALVRRDGQATAYHDRHGHRPAAHEEGIGKDKQWRWAQKNQKEHKSKLHKALKNTDKGRVIESAELLPKVRHRKKQELSDPR